VTFSFTVRGQRADDRASVRDVLTRAFDRPVVADLAEALRDARPGNAALSFVAESDSASESGSGSAGQVVGQVQLSTGWLDAAERLVEVLVLSPLGIVPEYQQRGVGTRLVEHAVHAADAVGAPMIFLEGDPRYYSRLGFERAGPLGFAAPSVRIPDAGFQVLTLAAYRPWMTGAVVYADPFWTFDCVGLRPPPRQSPP
jgi:putative acetyltransferase